MNQSGSGSHRTVAFARRWGWIATAAGVVILAASALVVAPHIGGGGAADTPPQAETSYTPQDQQQADACDGIPAVAPADLHLLGNDTDVTGAVVCTDSEQDRPGDGRWTVREVHRVPAADLAPLLAAVRSPNTQPDGGACTADLLLGPDFVLTAADGVRIRPGLPGNGCHISDTALSAFAHADSWPVIASTTIRQVETEAEVATGCAGASSAPAIWLGAGPAGPNPRAVLPLAADARFSVCRYDSDGGPKGGTLAAVGTIRGAAVNTALADTAAPLPTACATTTPGEADHAPHAGSWLYVQPAPGGSDPDAASGRPALMIETGGCHRVIDGDQMAVLGAVPAATVAGWADRPAH